MPSCAAKKASAALVREVARHARVAGEHHVVAVADKHGHLLAGNLTVWPTVPNGDIIWSPLPTNEGPDTIHAAIRTLPDGMRLACGPRRLHAHGLRQRRQRVARLAILRSRSRAFCLRAC